MQKGSEKILPLPMKGIAMLVLSRKKDQTIHIGDGVTIQICQIKGSTVRIGISAPEDSRILRGELAWFAEEPRRGSESDSGRSKPLEIAQKVPA